MIKYWTFPQMLHQSPVRTTKERNHETSVSLRNLQLLFVCFIFKFCICTLQPRISKSSAMINWTNNPYWSNIMKNFYIHMIYLSRTETWRKQNFQHPGITLMWGWTSIAQTNTIFKNKAMKLVFSIPWKCENIKNQGVLF